MADFKCKLYRSASSPSSRHLLSSCMAPAMHMCGRLTVAHHVRNILQHGMHANSRPTVLHCSYDQGSGEWKERGVGPMKLLRHKDNDRIRLLMRQDKTLKIRANHIGQRSARAVSD
jgi:RanBP1 domain